MTDSILSEGAIDYDLISDLDDYIFEHGVKVREKGIRVINSDYLCPRDYGIMIKTSFFKHNMSLLNRLRKLPICGRSDLFRIVVEDILEYILEGRKVVNLRSLEFLLEEDTY